MTAALVERHLNGRTAALGRLMPPGIVHQNAPHLLCGHPEELGPVLPVRLALIDEPQVSLVHQGSCLEGVSRALALEVALGLAVQLLVDDGHQLVERGRVSAAPCLEQIGHTLSWGGHRLPTRMRERGAEGGSIGGGPGSVKHGVRGGLPGTVAPKPDPYAGWSLGDRLQMLAFEAELARLPRSLIGAIWEAFDTSSQKASQKRKGPPSWRP